MTFYELFETNEQKLERKLKESDDWQWVDVCDDHTNKWSTVARLCFHKEDLFDLAKKMNLQPGDVIEVKGIGKLYFGYWYLELKEKE